MTISAKMDQRLITLSFTRFVTSCLTRISLQLAIYFCPPQREVCRKTLQVGKLSANRLDVQFHHRMDLPNSVVRHVLSTVALIFRSMAYNRTFRAALQLELRSRPLVAAPDRSSQLVRGR